MPLKMVMSKKSTDCVSCPPVIIKPLWLRQSLRYSASSILRTIAKKSSIRRWIVMGEYANLIMNFSKAAISCWCINMLA